MSLAATALTVTGLAAHAPASDWVAIAPNAVWVGSTVPNAVHRIDPRSNQRVATSADSVWLAVDDKVLASIKTGPNPRFLTASPDAIWTLNQGDGSVTRVDSQMLPATKHIRLGTPGHGGDIGFGENMVWTTVFKTPLSVVDGARAELLCQWKGPGGDSLGIGHGAIWLTDYDGGTISRFEIADALGHGRHSR